MLFGNLSAMSLKKIVFIAFVVSAVLSAAMAQDQGRRVELQESLQSRYRLTVLGGGFMGVRGGENAIRRAGGVITVVRDGLYGSYDRAGQPSNAIRNGKAELLSGEKSVALQRGERFYVTAIHVGDDVVTMGLVSVRMIPSNTRTAQVWCSVNFFFPKETLTQGDIGKVYPVIDQWLLPEGAVSGPAVPAVATAPAPPANPVDLKPGMTRDEIVAALGTPVQEAGFGDHRWLTYPGMTITLEQGKLTTVERNAQPLVPVNISSDPAGADVYLDGNFVSSTPAVLRLQAGTYKVAVKMSGYGDWEREIKVLPGAEVNLTAKLSK